MTMVTPDVQKILDEANNAVSEISEPPEATPPMDTVFNLHAGYMQDDGSWTTEFEVRELTGRDEEALARVTDPGRQMVAILERGLVRVGKDKASPEVLDGLVAGDWETVLIAIRSVTFGKEIEAQFSCASCGQPYEVTVDLTKDLPVRTANREDLDFTVEGKRTTYEVSLHLGETQRKILELISKDGTTTADLNTLMLFESITGIGGRPVMGMDSVRDLPMEDRRRVLNEIRNRRVGPDLQGVRTKCPACGAEQPSPLSVAALFRN